MAAAPKPHVHVSCLGVLGSICHSLKNNLGKHAGNGLVCGQLPRNANLHAHKREGVADGCQPRAGGRPAWLRKVIHNAREQPGDLLERLRVLSSILEVAVENREARTHGIVHASPHPHDGLFLGNPLHLQHRGSQLLVGRLEQPVDALEARVERCLLGHVERHDAPAAPVAQRHRVANKESDRLGVGLDNQAVVRGLTGMGLETSPQPAGIREVCRKPQ